MLFIPRSKLKTAKNLYNIDSNKDEKEKIRWSSADSCWLRFGIISMPSATVEYVCEWRPLFVYEWLTYVIYKRFTSLIVRVIKLK